MFRRSVERPSRDTSARCSSIEAPELVLTASVDDIDECVAREPRHPDLLQACVLK